MNGLRCSTSHVCFSLLLAACAETATPEDLNTGGTSGTATSGAGGGAAASAGTTGGSGAVGNAAGASGAGAGGSSANNAGGVGGSAGGASGAAGTGVAGSNTAGTQASGGSGTAGDSGSAGVAGSGSGDDDGGDDTPDDDVMDDTSDDDGSDDDGAAGSGGDDDVEVVIDLPDLVTSAQGAYWQEGELTVMDGGGNANVTVNLDQEHQEWVGFGGTFNEKGWDALLVLSEADRLKAIDLLFDEADGAGFEWGRIPIGASDYALNRYTLNETAGDYAMDSFSIDRDQEHLIPYIRAAIDAKKGIRFWGSPWTPPTWMKSPAGYDGGLMNSDAQTLEAFALYLTKWVEAYNAEGIPIEGIMPQNEPGYEQDYPTCAWGPSSARSSPDAFLGTFVAQHLGPMLQEHGLDTKIWYGTLSNSGTVSNYLGNLSGGAEPYISALGLQWGTASQVNFGASRGWLVIQTEHQCGNYPWAGGYNAQQAPNDHAYGVESWGFLRDWINAGVNVYSAWNMVLDTVGRSLDDVRPWNQNALLAVNRQSQTLVITPTYYVFRHFSQFVDAGAVRVGTSGGDAVAFKHPDGRIVVVMYNQGGAGQQSVAIGDKLLQFSAPGNGWVTVNWAG